MLTRIVAKHQDVYDNLLTLMMYRLNYTRKLRDIFASSLEECDIFQTSVDLMNCYTIHQLDLNFLEIEYHHSM